MIAVQEERRARPRPPAVWPIEREDGSLICPGCRHYVGKGAIAVGTDFELLHKCGQRIRLTAEPPSTHNRASP